MDLPSFAPYGVFGLVPTLALLAVKILFAKVEDEQKREQARADRLEAELRELHAAIRNNYSVVLNDATKAVAEALAFIRHYGGGIRRR